MQAGCLVSAWENEIGNAEDLKSSPCYAIDIQSEGIWCVTGTTVGKINLTTVRHKEGMIQFRMDAHKGPVSSLTIRPDEKSLLSGGWDKSIKLWDLNTGLNLKTFGLSAQVISTANHPTDPNLFIGTTMDGIVTLFDCRLDAAVRVMNNAASKAPPFTLSSCWGPNGDSIFVARRNSSG